jgi:CubicO group peptidase (beta-lactamase class C family)
MQEKTRVGLGIAAWCVIFVVMALAGVVVVMRDNGTETKATGDVGYAYVERMPRVAPHEVGMSQEALCFIDSAAMQSIANGETPGVVIGVVRDGKLAYAKAFGMREYGDEAQPMTLDTRFDIASLTKPVATAIAIMQFVERGKVGLGDRVEKYIPGFQPWRSKEKGGEVKHITIQDLLAHSSGIEAYVSQERVLMAYPDAECVDAALLIRYIAEQERSCEPRTKSLYSCLNYIVLGEIVERVSGVTLAEYAQANIFAPLGMSETCFNPNETYAKMCAPTTYDEQWGLMRGVVHDPLSREVMEGVSGNAGLFTTLEDISIYAAMLLDGGCWSGERVLSERSVATMFARPRGLDDWDKAMCWSCVNGYSGLFGDLLTDAAVGHSGATGTSLVVDPELDVAIIILTNRVHSSSSSSASIRTLRSRVATAVAAAIED